MDLNKTYGIEDVDRSLNPTKTVGSRDGPQQTSDSKRGAKEKNSTNAPEKTNKQSSTLGSRRPREGECLRKGVTNGQSSNQQPEFHTMF
ncbi:hypothetical protein TNCV_3930031 [Trichonephila clavipes]|nr:hypothetical protein TNCV_3930031 [Trichonephila clavipes]